METGWEIEDCSAWRQVSGETLLQLWATWSSRKCHWSLLGGRTMWPLKVTSSPDHSMTLCWMSSSACSDKEMQLLDLLLSSVPSAALECWSCLRAVAQVCYCFCMLLFSPAHIAKSLHKTKTPCLRDKTPMSLLQLTLSIFLCKALNVFYLFVTQVVHSEATPLVAFSKSLCIITHSITITWQKHHSQKKVQHPVQLSQLKVNITPASSPVKNWSVRVSWAFFNCPKFVTHMLRCYGSCSHGTKQIFCTWGAHCCLFYPRFCRYSPACKRR